MKIVGSEVDMKNIEYFEAEYDEDRWFPGLDILTCVATTRFKDKQCWNPKSTNGILRNTATIDSHNCASAIPSLGLLVETTSTLTEARWKINVLDGLCQEPTPQTQWV